VQPYPEKLSRSSRQYFAMQSSIFFSFHPFPNIPRAILKLDANGFAASEKAHNVPINDANVFQIQDEIAAISWEFKELLQLDDRRSFDSAAEDEHGASCSRRCLNPKYHRSGRLNPHRSRDFYRAAYFFSSRLHRQVSVFGREIQMSRLILSAPTR
jgi:hypothetical protein